MKSLIDKLYRTHELKKEEWMDLLNHFDQDTSEHLFSLSRSISEIYFKEEIYIRGLIEFTNYCKNDCYYCGIRRSNLKAERYQLTEEDILSCCQTGHQLGFRTFVLQGGEDAGYDDERMVSLLKKIRQAYPDCAITLSFGEKTYEQYLQYYEAGANRYLLRHETADPAHYRRLHPQSLSLEHRQNCLWDLKKIGYQVGTGFMVGSPYQTTECLAEDLLFIQELSPHMVGIGPFIPHQDTPLGHFPAGSMELTLFLIGLLRLMLPKALLPATTALGTIDPQGREKGILAGANVLMPNLSPIGVRAKYQLYDNKICTGEEAAECSVCLRKRVSSVGYKVVEKRGDYQLGSC